jgi:hypothetical protein
MTFNTSSRKPPLPKRRKYIAFCTLRDDIRSSLIANLCRLAEPTTPLISYHYNRRVGQKRLECSAAARFPPYQPALDDRFGEVVLLRCDAVAVPTEIFRRNMPHVHQAA